MEVGQRNERRVQLDTLLGNLALRLLGHQYQTHEKWDDEQQEGRNVTNKLLHLSLCLQG